MKGRRPYFCTPFIKKLCPLKLFILEVMLKDKSEGGGSIR